MSLLNILTLGLLPRAARSSTPAPAPKKTKLAVEQLEDRVVPAITFASFTSGTWAYNTTNNSWRQLTSYQAKAMDEGSDGTLFASFRTASGNSTGTWRYVYQTDTFTKLAGAVATELHASNTNSLAASLPSGTWLYGFNGWKKMTSARASQLAAVSDFRFYGSFGNGTWIYNQGSWTRITPKLAGVMESDSAGALLATYNSGTWKHFGVWSKLSSSIAKDIAATGAGSAFYATFTSGTYFHNGSFNKLTAAVANQIGADTDSFVGGFASGTLEYQGSAFINLTLAKPNLIA